MTIPSLIKAEVDSELLKYFYLTHGRIDLKYKIDVLIKIVRNHFFKILSRQSTIEDMQVDETETKNFKRLDDQELEDLELQDDKKNNFKIKYDELLKSIQEHNS